MTKADGTPVTVYVDKDFNVVSTDSGEPQQHRVTPSRARRGRTAAGSQRLDRHGVPV